MLCLFQGIEMKDVRRTSTDSRVSIEHALLGFAANQLSASVPKLDVNEVWETWCHKS
jgi:hypothetical protein